MRSPNWDQNKEFWEKKGKIPLWKVASVLNIHEKTLSIWLRFEVTGEKRDKIFSALEKVKAEENDKQGVKGFQ